MHRKPQPSTIAVRRRGAPPPPPEPFRWTIYKLAARQTWIGEVEAATKAEAVEKAAAEFKLYAPKLMAVRRAEPRSP
jgi:hypothetical protein